MASYAINIRTDSFHPTGKAVRLPRTALRAARRVYGLQVLLYGVRDEPTPGYFAIATVGDTLPNPAARNTFWLELLEKRPLIQAVEPFELYRFLNVDALPFHRYSRPIHLVGDPELLAITALSRTDGLFEQSTSYVLPPPSYADVLRRIRASHIRFRTLEIYGGNCAFANVSNKSLDGLRFGLDVCHIKPLSVDGPDMLFNTMPLLQNFHWMWDEGLVSITNSGVILIAHNANDYVRSQLAPYRQAKFPDNPKNWPKAEMIEFHRDTIFEKGPYKGLPELQNL